MKTPDDIKKALTCSCDMPDCENCAYVTKVNDDKFGEVLHFHCSKVYMDAYELICQLESRLAQAERERDAAVEDLEEIASILDVPACSWCKYEPYEHKPCKECRMKNEGFEWRGICAENTKDDAVV